jgi:hypothetical protein
MNIDISYGNTIYADNRIARYTEFMFDSLNDLEQFWVSRKEDDEGRWEANVKSLVVTYSDWVSSEEFFEVKGEEAV